MVGLTVMNIRVVCRPEQMTFSFYVLIILQIKPYFFPIPIYGNFRAWSLEVTGLNREILGILKCRVPAYK